MDEATAPERSAMLGLAALMRMTFENVDLAPLSARLLERARADPADADALMDLSLILQFTGKRDLGLAVQDLALDSSRIYHQRAATAETGLRLLAISAPGDLTANSPLAPLLEGSDVALTTLYVRAEDRALDGPVPEHDLAFVTVGESQANARLLENLAQWLEGWPRPILNRPEAILLLSRAAVAARLQGLLGVEVPACVRAARSTLDAVASGTRSIAEVLRGAGFPVIVRPLDAHGGHDLERIERAEALGAYLARVAHSEFFVAPFVDYRSADGAFRKYRVVCIGGAAYACHMAISDHWMIHYLNAGMGESAAKRAEEAAFMAGFDAGFGLRHRTALAAIAQRIGLDYFGIDCAESNRGELLVFEVDPAMIVHAMDPPALYPYKLPQMRKVFAAFRAMLGEAARGAS